MLTNSAAKTGWLLMGSGAFGWGAVFLGVSEMTLRCRSESPVVRVMKIGLMGGSFDPVHIGHLIMARDVMEQLSLDRMILVPAAQAPLKPQDVQATAEDRLAMLRAAIREEPGLEVSDFELSKGGISYTIDTVRFFRQKYLGDVLYWVIGGDQLLQLPKWKDIGELVKLVEFVALDRPGYPLGQLREIAGLVLHRGNGHLIEISSSELRDRVRRGLTLNNFTPQKVIAYIGEKGLYRCTHEESSST